MSVAYMLYYLLTGMMVGSALIFEEIEPANASIAVTRWVLRLNVAWCLASVAFQASDLQWMAGGLGLEVADDVVLIALAVVGLQKLWWLRTCGKEESHVGLDS